MPSDIPNRSGNAFLRLFAVSALALAASAALPGCGKVAKAVKNGVDSVNRMEKNRQLTAQTMIRNFETALDNYKLDVGTYPDSLQHLVQNIDDEYKWEGPYMKSIPKDPWGNEYMYDPYGEHNQGSYDIWSYGADGLEGGEGYDKDITNWFDEFE